MKADQESGLPTYRQATDSTSPNEDPASSPQCSPSRQPMTWQRAVFSLVFLFVMFKIVERLM
jgi:hypothetical protein